MVKDHSDSEKGHPLPPHELHSPISSMGSFICIIPQVKIREQLWAYLEIPMVFINAKRVDLLVSTTTK